MNINIIILKQINMSLEKQLSLLLHGTKYVLERV